MARPGPDAMRRDSKGRNFASLANIAHLHFRFARQVGEHRMVGLNATTNSHVARADAIDFAVLRQCAPGHRDCAAKAGTAHVFRVALFVGVATLPEADCCGQLASTPAAEPSQAERTILPGGYWLSSGEDRRSDGSR